MEDGKSAGIGLPAKSRAPALVAGWAPRISQPPGFGARLFGFAMNAFAAACAPLDRDFNPFTQAKDIPMNSLKSQKLRNLFRWEPYIPPRRISSFSVNQRESSAVRPGEGKNTNAVSGRCSLRIAAVQESSGFYWNGHFDAGAWHRRDHLHLYSGTCCAAEVAASGQAW